MALAPSEVGVPLSRDQQVQARISVDLGTVPFGSIALPALRNYLLSFIFFSVFSPSRSSRSASLRIRTEAGTPPFCILSFYRAPGHDHMFSPARPPK
jgi:hypothetical protein